MEIWKDIPEYEGYYQVSNFGAVKGIDRVVMSSNFKARKIKGIILSVCCNVYGYPLSTLSRDGVMKSFLTHILVANAFIPNPENKPQINHVNGIKTDNRVENLEWVTCSENIRHAFSAGLKQGPKGALNGMTKLTESQAREIKYCCQNLLIREVSDLYGISNSVVCEIRSGKMWKHI